MGSGLIMTDMLARERLKNVTVAWAYPRHLDNLWYDEQLNNVGLYYISRKFGTRETLIYIGQTYDSYYNRLVAHDFNWLGNVRGKIFIRLGTIEYPANKTDDEMKLLIKDVEGALIFEMRDVLRNNVMGTKSYTPKHLYLITNTGYRGELSATVSMKEHNTPVD